MRTRTHRFIATSHLRNSKYLLFNHYIYLFWPWRARPVPFWANGLRFEPLEFIIVIFNKPDFRESFHTMCASTTFSKLDDIHNQIHTCHTTTRWRISSRSGMPKTRLFNVIISSVFSPVNILYTGNCFTLIWKGSNKGVSTLSPTTLLSYLGVLQRYLNHQPLN